MTADRVDEILRKFAHMPSKKEPWRSLIELGTACKVLLSPPCPEKLEPLDGIKTPEVRKALERAAAARAGK